MVALCIGCIVVVVLAVAVAVLLMFVLWLLLSCTFSPMFSSSDGAAVAVACE